MKIRDVSIGEKYANLELRIVEISQKQEAQLIQEKERKKPLV